MTSRRRGAELEDALLQAAWDELVDKGYASFTLDAVADRAHTSRPVLYRRWPDKHALVRAAIGHVIERNRIPVPDTGSLRGDVLALLREVNATRVPLSTMFSVHLAGYYQETGTSPADLKSLIAGQRVSYLDVIFARALERGEVDPARLTDRIKSLPFDLLRQEFLMTFSPVTDDALVEIVDTLFLPLVQPRPPSVASSPALRAGASRES
jgi:AcrR family transcriptional regulator